MFYNYFRFYNPEIGRYIENAPIDLQGGLNRYGYVGGSPLHAVDPYGLFMINPVIFENLIKSWNWNGTGDVSVCSYYDNMYNQTQCPYYKSAGDICKGNNRIVNSVINIGIVTSWTTNQTRNSQSQVLNIIHQNLILEDSKARNENRLDECSCTLGNDIDDYHNLAFTRAGIHPIFYGGNLWFQAVPLNPVPYDPRNKSHYDPRTYNYYTGINYMSGRF